MGLFLVGLALGESVALCDVPDAVGICNGTYRGNNLLWLPRRGLSGTLPSELSELTSLTSMALHFNDLSGTLPTQIGQLTQLTSFEVQQNKLSGTIPSEYGRLTNLGHFNVGANKLSGSLPQELTSLTANACAILCSQHIHCHGGHGGADTNQFACPLPSWSPGSACGTGLSCSSYPPRSPPSSPPPLDSAIIELTGPSPVLKFGPVQSPVCEFKLDHVSNRFHSTCDIVTPSGGSGRRLAGEDEMPAVSWAEHAAMKDKFEALEAKYATLQEEVGELQRVVLKALGK